jgi:hypothetical protein
MTNEPRLPRSYHGRRATAWRRAFYLQTRDALAPPKPAPRTKPHSSLAAWRQELGITQRQAAEQLGISQSYYWKLECGTQPLSPRRDILQRLVDITGVPVDVLLRLGGVQP